MAGITQTGIQDGTPTGWYYLDLAGQHVGPYTAGSFIDLYSGGHVTDATLIWKEGLPGWQPLAEVPEIKAAVSALPSAAASAGGAALQPATGTSAAQPVVQRRGATVVKAAKAERIAPVDRELAAFQAEMSALGATAAPGAEGGDVAVEPERAETPPPEDRRFQDDDGTWFVWDSTLRRFVEDDGAAQAPALPEYKVEEMTFEMDEETIPAYKPPKVDDSDEEEEPGPSNGKASGDEAGSNGNNGSGKGEADADADRKKTGAESVLEKHQERQKRAREQAEAQAQWFDLKENTSVYMTGLPDDVTEAEIAQTFAKCGILKEDDDGRPRVKIYRDKATGMVKGDGLVTYLKGPSVELACKILDGAPLRDDPSKTMTVQPAKFEMHGEQYVPKKKPNKKKKKVVKEEKMLGWGGFDDLLPPTKVTVILKHMFHPNELMEEPSTMKDLETDITAECAKLGAVDKVRIFQYHPEGVVSVKFREEEPAQACIKLMHGRFFGGRQLTAEMWDGLVNYNVKKPKESAEEQAARLEKFAAEIENS